MADEHSYLEEFVKNVQVNDGLDKEFIIKQNYFSKNQESEEGGGEKMSKDKIIEKYWDEATNQDLGYEVN